MHSTNRRSHRIAARIARYGPLSAQHDEAANLTKARAYTHAPALWADPLDLLLGFLLWNAHECIGMQVCMRIIPCWQCQDGKGAD